MTKHSSSARNSKRTETAESPPDEWPPLKASHPPPTSKPSLWIDSSRFPHIVDHILTCEENWAVVRNVSRAYRSKIDPLLFEHIRLTSSPALKWTKRCMANHKTYKAKNMSKHKPKGDSAKAQRKLDCCPCCFNAPLRDLTVTAVGWSTCSYHGEQLCGPRSFHKCFVHARCNKGLNCTRVDDDYCCCGQLARHRSPAEMADDTALDKAFACVKVLDVEVGLVYCEANRITANASNLHTVRLFRSGTMAVPGWHKRKTRVFTAQTLVLFPLNYKNNLAVDGGDPPDWSLSSRNDEAGPYPWSYVETRKVVSHVFFRPGDRPTEGEPIFIPLRSTFDLYDGAQVSEIVLIFHALPAGIGPHGISVTDWENVAQEFAILGEGAALRDVPAPGEYTLRVVNFPSTGDNAPRYDLQRRWWTTTATAKFASTVYDVFSDLTRWYTFVPVVEFLSLDEYAELVGQQAFDRETMP